jgi:hypothetical protein
MAVVMLMVAACGGRDADTLVEYSGASNGVMRWTYEMRVREDGSLSVASDQNCPGGKAEAQLDSEAMARLRSVLDAARLGEKQSVHEPGVNPREFEIRSGRHLYRFLGFGPADPDVEALVHELDGVMEHACGGK